MTPSRSAVLTLAAVCVAAVHSAPLGAQSVASSIAGTVTDAVKAVIPQAAVTLKNVETGVQLSAETNASGSYSFPSVAPGRYALSVAKDGFANYTLEFTVVVGERATRDAVLGVTAAQTVTVESDSMAALQSDSNDLGTVIGPQSVSQLPLNGRNFLQLALLSGVTQVPSGAASASTGQTGHPSLAINVAGNQPDFTMYLVDGIKTFGSRAGNSSLNISVSAIDQFEVHYGFFMPDLGPNPGIVDVITKSGTNRFHGEVYEYVRTNQMRAKDYFNRTQPNPPYHQNQFGASLGGPILHNKLFFFANYEGYRQTQSNFTTALVPSAQQFAGNFSSLSTPIYDPASYNPVTGQRRQFAGNIIPASRINPVSQKLLAYYLQPNASASSYNLTGTPRYVFNSDQGTGRIDYSLGERNQLFAQASVLESPVVSPGLFPTQGTTFPLDTELIAPGWTGTLSQSKVNELRVGWTRNSVFSQGLSVPGVQSQLGITGTADPNGVPGIQLNGYAGFGTSSGLLGDVDNVYQFHDSFSWLHGHHQIKFGGDLDYTRSVNASANATARAVSASQEHSHHS